MLAKDEKVVKQKQLSEDVLDHVFQYLSIEVLCRSAEVCKLWYEVAQRAMAKRCFQHVVMKPHVYQHKDFISEFKIKPNSSLFFCASRPGLRNADNIEYATLYQYHHKFPHMGHTIMLGVEHSMLDTVEIRSCYEFNQRTQQSFTQNGVLGINLADTKDMIVKIAWCESCAEGSFENAQRILKQLQPNDGQGNPVYLMFGRNGYTVGTHVMTMLRQKYKDRQPNLWGGTMGQFIKCNDSYPKATDDKVLVNDNYISLHGFLGILVQRPRLSAYTTVVKYNDDLTARLAEFKLTVMLRQRSIGLVCGPHSKNKVYVYKTTMDAIKRQFPQVTFSGYFNGPHLQYYGCDNKDTDGSKRLIHEKAISIMILTYD